MLSTQSFKQAFSYFKDPRLVTIFFFGIASGFPWVMIGSALSAWLKDEGLSRTNIGLFGFIFAVYSINFLWSSIVERIQLPFIGKRFGQRRSWIFLTQVGVVLSCYQLFTLDPQTQLASLALAGLILAICSSTQDIAVDAYRIDTIGTENTNLMSAGSAMATAGWWTGYGGLGTIPFILADLPNWEWHQVFMVLTAIMAVLTLVVLFVSEPKSVRSEMHKAIEDNFLRCIPNHKGLTLSILAIILGVMAILAYAGLRFPSWPTEFAERSTAPFIAGGIGILLIIFLGKQLGKLHNAASNSRPLASSNTVNGFHKSLAWMLVTFVSPIHEFFNRNGVKFALSILLFIFLFKIGEAFLGRMSIVFYKEVGFSNTDIGIYSKLMNWWVTIVFSLIGSVFTIRYGVLKGLFIGGIAMAASNLLFALIAVVGPSKPLFAITVFVDGFTSAWGSVAFVALLSVLCNKAFTATQYALMASLGTFGRVTLGSFSGVLVDGLDGNWTLFFVLTALMVIPSLLFLYYIRKPLTKIIEQNAKA